MTFATQFRPGTAALFAQVHMASQALMVKRFLEAGLRFPVVARGALDVFRVFLQLAFLQHILSILIPVMALKALQAFHMLRMLKCYCGALFALIRIGVVDQNLFRLPERNRCKTKNRSKNRKARLPYSFCYPTHFFITLSTLDPYWRSRKFRCGSAHLTSYCRMIPCERQISRPKEIIFGISIPKGQ